MPNRCRMPAGSQTITGIRLADGLSDRQGRLEVQLLGNDSWGSVCTQDWPGDLVPLAQLACRSLGFGGGVVRGGGWYGGEAQPAVADLQCGPEAADLNDCSFASAEARGCSEQQATVGVACDGEVDTVQQLVSRHALSAALRCVGWAISLLRHSCGNC